MKNLIRSLKVNGLTPRLHGNTKRLPKHTLTMEEVKAIVVCYSDPPPHTHTHTKGALLLFAPTDISHQLYGDTWSSTARPSARIQQDRHQVAALKLV